MENNQSTRLTAQHKKSQGVIGIFGDEAQKHDKEVLNTSQRAMERLQKEYPMLIFRYRKSLKKEK